jgi:hypothetical protein
MGNADQAEGMTTMGHYQPQMVAGLQVLLLEDPRTNCMFFPMAADADGPAEVKADAGFMFFENAVDAADQASMIESVSGTKMRIGVASILPGYRMNDANGDIDGMPGAYDVDDNEDDESFPASAIQMADKVAAMKEAGADGVHFRNRDGHRTMLFDRSGFTVEGSFAVEDAAKVDRRCGMFERRNDGRMRLAAASEFMDADPVSGFGM